MTIGREEFLRLLPGAVGAFEADDDSIRGAEADVRWAIQLVPMQDGRLGRLTLPRHRVEITIEAPSEAEVESFMSRVCRAFLRAGG